MDKYFTETAWDDISYWQRENRAILKRIIKLVDDIEQNGNKGIGKPEPLKYDMQGFWSRRITDKDRLIYKIERRKIIIIACRFHYHEN